MLKKKAMVFITCFCVLAVTVAGAVGLPNPVRDVTSEEMINETGISFVIPEGVTDEIYSIITMEADISQVQFTLDGIEYCYRIQPSDELSDISGMHYEWTVNSIVELPYAEAEVHFNEGEAGIILWYSAVMGLICSVSMDSGATEAALVAAAELNASWQAQDEDCM